MERQGNKQTRTTSSEEELTNKRRAVNVDSKEISPLVAKLSTQTLLFVCPVPLSVFLSCCVLGVLHQISFAQCSWLRSQRNLSFVLLDYTFTNHAHFDCMTSNKYKILFCVLILSLVYLFLHFCDGYINLFIYLFAWFLKYFLYWIVLIVSEIVSIHIFLIRLLYFKCVKNIFSFMLVIYLVVNLII